VSEIPFSAHWIASQPLEAQRTAIQALNPDQLLKLRHEWTWWARERAKAAAGCGWAATTRRPFRITAGA
jgi:hypothetical protein